MSKINKIIFGVVTLGLVALGLNYHYSKNLELKAIEETLSAFQAAEIEAKEISTYPQHFLPPSKKLHPVCPKFPIPMFSEIIETSESNTKFPLCVLHFNSHKMVLSDRIIITNSLMAIIQSPNWDYDSSEGQVGIQDWISDSKEIPFKDYKKLSIVEAVDVLLKTRKPSKPSSINESFVEQVLLYSAKSMMYEPDSKVLQYKDKSNKYLLVFIKRKESNAHSVEYYSNTVNISCTHGFKEQKGSYQPCLNYFKYLKLID